MEFALWSRGAVKKLIERDYLVTLHLRSVGKYLARWASRRKSRSSVPTNSHPKPYVCSWMTPIRVSPSVPKGRALRFTGATRRLW